MTRHMRTVLLAAMLAMTSTGLRAEGNGMAGKDRAREGAQVMIAKDPMDGRDLAIDYPPDGYAADGQFHTYPQTRQSGEAETQFGERIADPYRWLENDVRTDPEVAGWVERQNTVTRAYLDALPQRQWFEQRLRGLLDYERFGLPAKAGGHYFYTHNTGLQNQSPLYVRRGLRGKPRLLIDPNAWAKDSATALDDWKPSDDGKYLLYSVQDGGSDWRVLKVLDVATGKELPDEVHWAKFTALAWVGSEGFLY